MNFNSLNFIYFDDCGLPRTTREQKIAKKALQTVEQTLLESYKKFLEKEKTLKNKG